MGRMTTFAVGMVLAFVAGVTVSFFTLPLWVGFLINIAKEGPRTDWLGFVGAVFGGFATLGAGVAAWAAVQRQIAAPDEARRRAQAEAKNVGVVAISQLVHVSSMLLYSVQIALAANTQNAQREWDGVVDRVCAQVSVMLDHFVLREIASELEVNDRAHFLMIILRL